jgi:hypothetical protein
LGQALSHSNVLLPGARAVNGSDQDFTIVCHHACQCVVKEMLAPGTS